MTTYADPSQRHFIRRRAISIISIVVLAAIGIAFFLSYEGSRSVFSSSLNSPTSESPSIVAASPDQITDVVAIVTDPARHSFVGRAVKLADVPVLRVVGDYTFWAGTSKEHSVPVVIRGELTGAQADSVTQVRANQRLDIRGNLRPVSELGKNLPTLKLTEVEAAEVERIGLFLLADNIVVSSAP